MEAGRKIPEPVELNQKVERERERNLLKKEKVINHSKYFIFKLQITYKSDQIVKTQ